MAVSKKVTVGAIVPLILFLALVIGLFTATNQTQQQQDLESKAATMTEPNIAFSSSTEDVVRDYVYVGRTVPGLNPTLQVPIRINPGANDIVGVDVIAQFDTSILRLENIVENTETAFESFFPAGTDANLDRQAVISQANATGQISFSAVAFYASEAAPIGGSQALPAGYGEINPFTLATLEFSGKQLSSGTNVTYIALDNSTTDTNLASFGLENDVLTDTQTLIVQVLPEPTHSPTPTPTPTETPTPTPTNTPTPTLAPFSVDGQAWVDLNDDGSRDTNEPTYQEPLRFELVQPNGEIQYNTTSANTTPYSWTYKFITFQQGNHTIRTIVPEGYAVSPLAQDNRFVPVGDRVETEFTTDFGVGYSTDLGIVPIPTITPTPTNTPTPIPTNTPSPTPTNTPTPTLTPTPIPQCDGNLEWDGAECECPNGVIPHTDGNANCDGKVNSLDFLIWFNAYKNGAYDQRADFYKDNTDKNGNPVIDILDYIQWFNNIEF